MNKLNSIFYQLIQFFMNIIIILLQIIAPIFTYTFLILSLLSVSYLNNIIFLISFVLYILGLFTSNLAKSLNTARAFKSHFENHHPFLNVLLNIFITFFFPFLITLVWCLISGNFTFYFQQVLITYLGWRIINAITGIKRDKLY